MWSPEDEFEKAIITLDLGTDTVSKLHDELNRELYFELLSHFVESGDRRWWWEDFKSWFIFKKIDQPHQHLPEIMPDLSKKVWLMLEDDQKTYFPIYDIEPLMISKLLDECFGFEYYVISKDLDWLLCETHHRDLIGVGKKIKEHNRGLIDDQG